MTVKDVLDVGLDGVVEVMDRTSGQLDSFNHLFEGDLSTSREAAMEVTLECRPQHVKVSHFDRIPDVERHLQYMGIVKAISADELFSHLTAARTTQWDD